MKNLKRHCGLLALAVFFLALGSCTGAETPRGVSGVKKTAALFAEIGRGEVRDGNNAFAAGMAGTDGLAGGESSSVLQTSDAVGNSSDPFGAEDANLVTVVNDPDSDPFGSNSSNPFPDAEDQPAEDNPFGNDADPNTENDDNPFSEATTDGNTGGFEGGDDNTTTDETTGATTDESIAVTISTDKLQYAATDSMSLSGGITVANPTGNKDVYIAIFTANATFYPLVVRDDVFVFGDVGSVEATFPNWVPTTIQVDDFFTVPTLEGVPTGTYTWRMIVTEAGGDMANRDNWLQFAETEIVIGEALPASVVLSISTDKTTYLTSESMKLSGAITASGSNSNKDVYIAVATPDGTFFPLIIREGVFVFGAVNTSEPLFPNWIPETIDAPEFFTIDSLVGLPSGAYSWYMILTEPGADVMVQGNWWAVKNFDFEIQNDDPVTTVTTAPTLSIQTDKATYSTGDALSLSIDFTLGSALTNKDVYVVAFAPDGNYFCLTTNNNGAFGFAAINSAQALFPGWLPETVSAPDFFALPSLASLPEGDYKWVLALTEPGASAADTNNWLYRNDADFTVTAAPINENSAIALALNTNKDVYSASDSLHLSGTIGVTGGHSAKDVFISVVLPDGSFFPLINQDGVFTFGAQNAKQPLYSAWAPSNVDAPNFFTLNSLAGIPSGTYTWWIAITEVGGDATNVSEVLYNAEHAFEVTAEAFSVSISADKTAYPDRGRMALSAAFNVSGTHTEKDIYLAVFVPDGTFYSLVTGPGEGQFQFGAVGVATPAFASWAPGSFNSPDFFVLDSLADLPPGAYYWQLIVTEPGANVGEAANWVQQSRWDFTVGQ